MGNMVKIPLTQGKVAIIDENDYQLVSSKKWYFDSTGYPASNNRSSTTKCGWKPIRLHTFLLNPPNGMVVDHINRDKLDNRRSNLRIVTHSINHFNSKLLITNKSGINGVFYDKQRKKWTARIEINSKSIFLGRFLTIEEAANARKQAERKYLGSLAL